jgi:uncharacterized protein (DUF305 family)
VIISLNCRKYAMALALAVGVAGVAGAQQPPHKGHDTKAGQSHSKMSMPALDDAHFAEMMRKHHQHGIELSKIEESKGTRDEVKALAAKIRQGQERDLKELESGHADHSTGRAAAGTKAQGTAGGASSHGTDMQKHHEMMEQMSKESKQKVENASGAAVDQAFLQEMAVHHQMALEMISKAKLKDASLRKLAQKMSAEQKKELAELKKLQSSAR